MEELLPILLGILWFVVSIINRNKKKQRKKTIPAFEKAEPKSEQKDYLEEVLSAFRNGSRESYFEEEKELFVEEEIQPIKKSNEFALFKEGSTSFNQEGSKVFSHEEIEKLNKIKKSNAGSKIIAIDLKKAFVYDAIFNPPYIEKYY